MGLLRGIARTAPLVAAGAAAGWYLRRQGLLGAPPLRELSSPPEPPPHEPEPIESHVEAVEAVSDAADVTSVIEDLLAVAPGEEEPGIVDAEVVDDGEPDPQD